MFMQQSTINNTSEIVMISSDIGTVYIDRQMNVVSYKQIQVKKETVINCTSVHPLC